MYVSYLVIVPALEGDHFPVMGTSKQAFSYCGASKTWKPVSADMEYFPLQNDAIHLKNWMVVPC